MTKSIRVIENHSNKYQINQLKYILTLSQQMTHFYEALGYRVCIENRGMFTFSLILVVVIES